MPKFGTDYSNSAIDLKNPLEVRDLLLAYGKAQDARDIAQGKLQAIIDKLPEQVEFTKAVADMAQAHKAVKAAIDRCGSYQDIPAGLYALKQGRTSVAYNPNMVREMMPQFASAVITEVVDSTKIHGLIKGGLLDAVTQERIAVRTELAPAYIIDLAPVPEPKEAVADGHD